MTITGSNIIRDDAAEVGTGDADHAYNDEKNDKDNQYYDVMQPNQLSISIL